MPKQREQGGLAMSTRFRTLVGMLAAAVPPASHSADLIQPIATPGSPVIIVGATIRLTTTGSFTDATTRLLSNATLAAGGNHVCVLAADGEIRCWGRGTSGQLGDGGNADSLVPVTVAGIDTATALGAGGDSSCALLADTTLRCWGRGLEGQLGNGGNAASGVPVTVTGVNAVALAMGFHHACAVLAGGGVRCWGANGSGQLGNGSVAGSPTAVSVSGITTATAVATGGNHSCALLAAGGVQCWGDGAAGQLGNGGFAGSSTPVAVSGISDAVAIAAGFDHTCALIAGGNLRCWGRGLEGQLGNANFANSATPVSVPVGALVVVALAAGSSHTCVVLDNGTMQCWGKEANGQVGNGSIAGNTASPVKVLNITNAIAVAAGFEHTCAVLGDGDTRCWGLNDGGQLGVGLSAATLMRSGTPVVVSGPVLGFDAGGNHTCAFTPTGTVNCWGSNAFGEAGNNLGSVSGVPNLVFGLDATAGSAAENAVSLGLGADHSCAALASGRAKCWGRNEHGQLGRNVAGSTLPQAFTPDNVFQTSTAARVASGATHSCTVLANATVQCWGSNAFGALGTSAAGDFTFPQTVVGIGTASRTSVGLNFSCALLAGGTVQCWGRGDEGQLGNGFFANSSTPVTVVGITTATSIGVGDAHACARIVGGTVRCWGRNFEGQLGNSSNTASGVPVSVTGLTTAAGVAGGGSHTCAVLTTGGVNCWGRGDSGQLGNGFFVNINAPVVASGVAGAIAIDAGRAHTCAGFGNGRMRCWGDGSSGQLGNGLTGAGVVAATAVPVNGINMDAPALAWTSSDTTVATVDMNGHVHAVGVGQATLRPRYDSRTSTVTVTVDEDTDGDGIANALDNCIATPNTNQRDTDGDGFGNVCDADLNNDNIVNFGDLALFRARFGTSDADADFNGDGAVNFADLAIFRSRFGRPPGEGI
jgi:alpha-tubulin suppressor-like RCC1 family protein